jgi:hypothetical protein
VSDHRLTPGLREMLERIKAGTDRNGSQMLLTITAAGLGEARKLKRLLAAEWVAYCDHNLPRGPVPGVAITDAGRAILSAKP